MAVAPPSPNDANVGALAAAAALALALALPNDANVRPLIFVCVVSPSVAPLSSMAAALLASWVLEA